MRKVLLKISGTLTLIGYGIIGLSALLLPFINLNYVDAPLVNLEKEISVITLISWAVFFISGIAFVWIKLTKK